MTLTDHIGEYVKPFYRILIIDMFDSISSTIGKQISDEEVVSKTKLSFLH